MNEARQPSRFHAEWNLAQCRATPQLEPASHQADALRRLADWYKKRGQNGGGGILVLPTGGGKTFTAVRFLAAGPLSDNYKVLWLAHTHHLLEQAFDSFRANTLGVVREPRRELRLRVVSGTPGHFPPRDIRPDDDVVVATLQTVTHAFGEKLSSLMKFLRAAGDKLFVVFDEAHHAPAPSYRKLLMDLRASSAPVLGLTATPVYSDENKQGWLKKLFPDGILAQAHAAKLMAAGVLARPRVVTLKTAYEPSFEDVDYEKWLGTYRDIPDDIINDLAKNAERNAFIARAYADNRKVYKKTIIFTDRWYQCEAIAAELEKLGIKAGAVYSHVDATLPTVDQRQRRSGDENARVIERFRKNQIQVLINVRMLTEGTDIPDAETVFLTRQTTSRILLTQMVGRALRGPKFGGTAEAHIVSFEDDWRQQIQWAEFELEDGGTEDQARQHEKRPPLQLISIDLVKKLARQMDGGVNVSPVPFQTLLPVGWYRTTFDARTKDSDDVESKDLLVMVFEDERKGFEGLIKKLLAAVPESLRDESATLKEHHQTIEGYRSKFLAGANRNAADLDAEILAIACHIAQRGDAPRFFSFEARADHDLDKLAEDFIDRDFGPRALDEALRAEYARSDRFWRTLFHRYEQFRHFHDGCQARILQARMQGEEPHTYRPPTPKNTQAPTPSEADEHVKWEVMLRDGQTCLACGGRKFLQVDHIMPVYHGGSNEPGNLQTLCKRCNAIKDIQTIRFTSHSTLLAHAPRTLPEYPLPSSDDAANREQWEKFLRRTLNFFFQCGAVGQVLIAGCGEGYYNWRISLRSGNSPAWLKPHIPALIERIQQVREKGGKPPIKSLRVTAPGHDEVIVKA